MPVAPFDIPRPISLRRHIYLPHFVSWLPDCFPPLGAVWDARRNFFPFSLSFMMSCGAARRLPAIVRSGVLDESPTGPGQVLDGLEGPENRGAATLESPDGLQRALGGSGPRPARGHVDFGIPRRCWLPCNGAPCTAYPVPPTSRRVTFPCRAIIHK